MNLDLRNIIKNDLKEERLGFVEISPRDDFGLIGYLTKNGSKIVTVFQKSFYVSNRGFPLNRKNLKIISNIQRELQEVTKDINNNIILLHQIRESI